MFWWAELWIGIPPLVMQTIKSICVLEWWGHDVKHDTVPPTWTSPNWHTSSEQGSKLNRTPCFELWFLLYSKNKLIASEQNLGPDINKVLSPDMVWGWQQTWSFVSLQHCHQGPLSELCMHNDQCFRLCFKHPATCTCSPWVFSMVSSHLLKMLW